MSKQEHPLGISFEFFPPTTEAGREKLMQTRDALAERKPQFFSVTYGAGGSTQARTVDAVERVSASGVTTAPHISCVGSEKADLRRLLNHYREVGIDSLVALRGDLPSGMGGVGELRYANELVEFIRAESGDHFEIAVAAYPESHPQAASFDQDVENFARKVKAGANLAITQYFFSADAYFHFVDRASALGVEVPVVPGIMPITNYTKLARFSDACGAEIPRWIRKQLEAYGDDQQSIAAFGEEVVTRLCQRLLDGGAPGLHFYALNQAAPSLRILDHLA